MNEAHGMADWICETLEKVGVKDGGAEYAITVTDTAGNVAEVFYEKSEVHGGPRWIWEEGCNVERLNLRVTHATGANRIQSVRLPDRAYETLRHLSAVLIENAATGAGNDAAFRKQLQDVIDAARWIA